MFGVKLESQKEEAAKKPFQYPAEMEVFLEGFWKATASKVHIFLQNAA